MLQDILEHHANELAFLWAQRDAAARAPHIDLRALAGFDERVEANVDGLRIAGNQGFAVARAMMELGEPGVAFAAALLAIERGDTKGLAAAMEPADDPAMARALISAFGWAPEARAALAAEPLLAPSAPPRHRVIGLAAFATHRRDAGGAILNSLLDQDAGVRARALRSAGEIGRRDLAPDLARALSDEDEACRFWAAWSLSLLGEAFSPTLWSFVESERYAMRAVAMAARRAGPDARALGRLEALSARAEHARVAIAGAGALGDPGAVPWLLARMEDEALARIAGEAFTMITGIAIEGELAAKPSKRRDGPSDDPADPSVAMDPDMDRPWPAKAALAGAFRTRGAELRRGQRYLLGQSISEGTTLRVLRDATQPLRAAAAIERSLLAPGRPLFEVRAPAFRQKVG